MGGFTCVDIIQNLKDGGSTATHPPCDVRIVEKAGHLLMLENSEETNRVLAQAVRGGGGTVSRGNVRREEETGRLVWNKKREEDENGKKVASNQI